MCRCGVGMRYPWTGLSRWRRGFDSWWDALTFKLISVDLRFSAAQSSSSCFSRRSHYELVLKTNIHCQYPLYQPWVMSADDLGPSPVYHPINALLHSFRTIWLFAFSFFAM